MIITNWYSWKNWDKRKSLDNQGPENQGFHCSHFPVHMPLITQSCKKVIHLMLQESRCRRLLQLAAKENVPLKYPNSGKIVAPYLILRQLQN